MLVSGSNQSVQRHQADFRVTKTSHVRRVHSEGLFDLCNLFNANPVLAYNSSCGSTWPGPTSILIGRLATFGMQITV